MFFKKQNSNDDRIKIEPGSSILFVCYGNICRSPMAEGLARKILRDEIRVESAGISPVLDGADERTGQVMKEIFDVDISSHRTRYVLSAGPEEFDHVVAMDRLVYDYLRQLKKIPQERLVLWVVEDPYSKGPDIYKRVAEEISRLIQDTFDFRL